MNRICVIFVMFSFLLQNAQENFAKKAISKVFSNQIEGSNFNLRLEAINYLNLAKEANSRIDNIDQTFERLIIIDKPLDKIINIIVQRIEELKIEDRNELKYIIKNIQTIEKLEQNEQIKEYLAEAIIILEKILILEKRIFPNDLSNIILDCLIPFQEISEITLHNVTLVSWSPDNSKLLIKDNRNLIILNVSKLSQQRYSRYKHTCETYEATRAGDWMNEKYNFKSTKTYSAGKEIPKSELRISRNCIILSSIDNIRAVDDFTFKWSCDGQYLATRDPYNVKIYNAENGEIIEINAKEYSVKPIDIQWSNSGNFLIVVFHKIPFCYKQSYLYIYDVDSKEINSIDQKSLITGIALSHNDKLIGCFLDTKPRVKIKEISSGKTIKKFAMPKDTYTLPSLSWSLDDATIFLEFGELGDRSKIEINLNTNKIKNNVFGINRANRTTISPSGKYIIYTDMLGKNKYQTILCDSKNNSDYIFDDICADSVQWSIDSTRFAIADKENSKIHIYEKIYEDEFFT
ncbi:MAG: hypothetical protein P4L22_06105 [Candidatus Babeliales bacterium]|nr:hypothetical protein [Candidatus Babeliales bacterium]